MENGIDEKEDDEKEDDDGDDDGDDDDDENYQISIRLECRPTLRNSISISSIKHSMRCIPKFDFLCNMKRTSSGIANP